MGLNNKKEILQIFLTKKTIWQLNYRNKNKNMILYKKIEPKKSFKEIVTLLKDISYKKNPILYNKFDESCFYKVVKGRRKTAYGWSLYFIYI